MYNKYSNLFCVRNTNVDIVPIGETHSHAVLWMKILNQVKLCVPLSKLSYSCHMVFNIDIFVHTLLFFKRVDLSDVFPAVWPFQLKKIELK